MPRTPKIYTEHLRLLVTPKQYDLIDKACALDHRKKPDFIRHYLEEVSKSILVKNANFAVLDDVKEFMNNAVKKTKRHK